MKIPPAIKYYQVMIIFHGNDWLLERQRSGRLVWTKVRKGTKFATKEEASDWLAKAPKKGDNLPFVADNWGRVSKQ